MSTIASTEKPRLKLNFGAKPLTLNTNASPLVAGSALKKVVVFEKPATQDIPKTKSETLKKSKKQEATASNKQVASDKKAASEKIVASPEEILKAKIKRRKKEYFSILTKLQTDYPQVFSKEPKPLAIGIDLELKNVLNGEFPNNQLGRFFHRYCGSFKYKEKLVEGAQRFNLDGSHATLVTKKEIPPIINKPKFVKKPKDAKDLDKNDSALS